MTDEQKKMIEKLNKDNRKLNNVNKGLEEYAKYKLVVGIIVVIIINYICLFDYLFISSQMSAKPYFIGSTGILLLW